LCVPEDELAAVFTTSGTTGEPKRVYHTFRDVQALTNLGAVALRAGHPGQLVALIALPMSHGLWMGSASAQRAVERAGGLPLPVGADDPRETLKWMQRFEPNVVVSSPSYFTVLTRVAEEAGYCPGLDMVLLGGEVLTGAQKTRFSEYWCAQVFDSYGSTEIGGGQTIALPECTAFNLNDLHLVTEIVDPETGEPADEGELVFTTLMREAMPLLRYRSGDRGRWANCACWLPFNAVQLAGRTDDMIVAGDMNLYGHVIADAAAKVAGSSGRVAIGLDKVELTDRLVLRVEGAGTPEEKVRQALFEVYPELRTNVANGNLVLTIETDVDLGRQIKALKIVDKRR
jgi:phenylacetate-CoA ligase